MVERSDYNGQIRIGDPRPIRSGPAWTMGSGSIAVAVVVGLFAFSIAFIPGRIMDWYRNRLGPSLPIRWRRLKRIIGLKRGVR